MTLIALILVLIVIRPPENVGGSCPKPNRAAMDWNNTPYPEYLNPFVAMPTGDGKMRKVSAHL